MVLGYYAWQRHFGPIRRPSDPLCTFGRAAWRIAHGDRCDAGKHGNDRRAHGLLHADCRRAKRRGDRLAQLIGRLRDGTALAAAADEANVIGAAVRPPRPASAPPLTAARFEVRS